MRISNLKKGVVGVCAATMLAGMCAVPAFAADGIPGVTPGTSGPVASGTADSSSTTVTAKTEAAQISVTVPTAVTAAVSSDGSMVFPQSSDFAIAATNASWPVKVSDLKVDVGSSGYDLKTSLSEVASSTDLYLAIDNKALAADTNTDAIASLKQASANGDPIGITMTGKMGAPSYANASTGITLVTLKWTLSAY